MRIAVCQMTSGIDPDANALEFERRWYTWGQLDATLSSIGAQVPEPGTQVGILLPYGRLQESEADQLGLIFMAMAGYDPHTAVDFWQRMANQKDQAAPPEFLSTHPAHATRIADIKNRLPEAVAYYRPEK